MRTLALVALEEQRDMGQRIKRLRKAKGWTQQRLAQEVGSSYRIVQQWEAGENQPREYLDQLARKLETTPQFILYGEPDASHGERLERMEADLETIRGQLDELLRRLREPPVEGSE